MKKILIIAMVLILMCGCISRFNPMDNLPGRLRLDALEQQITELAKTDPAKAADLQVRVNEIKSRYVSETTIRRWLGRLSLGLFGIAILLAWNKDLAQAIMCLIAAGALTAFCLLSARWIIYSFLVIPAMGLGMYLMSGRVKGGLFSFKSCRR